MPLKPRLSSPVFVPSTDVCWAEIEKIDKRLHTSTDKKQQEYLALLKNNYTLSLFVDSLQKELRAVRDGVSAINSVQMQLFKLLDNQQKRIADLENQSVVVAAQVSTTYGVNTIPTLPE